MPRKIPGAKRGVVVKGIRMSYPSYHAFTNYLNAVRAQSFVKADVELFLENWDTDPQFRKHWRSSVRTLMPPSCRIRPRVS